MARSHRRQAEEGSVTHPLRAMRREVQDVRVELLVDAEDERIRNGCEISCVVRGIGTGRRLAPSRVMTFRKILCPVDFSADAREARRLAIEMSGSDTQLVLVHVWQPPYVYGMDGGPPGPILVETQSLAEGDLARWKVDAEHLGARQVSTVLAIGAPWHEIVELARRDPAIDLIVMGTHGRTGIKHALLGSVAEKVVRHAPCPVLVVRNRD